MIVDDYPALIWKIKTNEKSAWYLYHIPFTKISKMWNLKKKKKWLRNKALWQKLEKRVLFWRKKIIS